MFGIAAALAALILDQLSKWQIADLFAEDLSVRVINPYFNIVEAWNTGVSFSMFSRGGFLGSIALIIFALGVVVFLLHWLLHEADRLVQIALGLIIGGALGNVCDRIRFGAVYDFLDFHYGNWHWPVFNMADVFICTGAFLIIVHSLVHRKKQSLKEIKK